MARLKFLISYTQPSTIRFSSGSLIGLRYHLRNAKNDALFFKHAVFIVRRLVSYLHCGKRRVESRKNIMKKTLILMAGFAAGILNAADLKVGDSAPDFALQGSDGKTYKL